MPQVKLKKSGKSQKALSPELLAQIMLFESGLQDVIIQEGA